MAHVRMPVRQRAGAAQERRDDALARHRRADRRVAGAESLAQRDDVGADAVVLEREQRAGAAHPAHHLVRDEQHAVPVADLADPREVARDRGDAAQRRADDGLGDERGDALRPHAPDLRVELVGGAQSVGGLVLIVAPEPVRVARRDVRDGHQQRRVERAPLQVAADRQRAQRVAVVAHPARDEVRARRLAALDDVLPRELQRDLHRLRSAADERDAAGAEARRRVPDEPFREGFRRRVREERRVRVLELRRLPRDRRDDAGMAVARGSTRRRRPMRRGRAGRPGPRASSPRRPPPSVALARGSGAVRRSCRVPCRAPQRRRADPPRARRRSSSCGGCRACANLDARQHALAVRLNHASACVNILPCECTRVPAAADRRHDGRRPAHPRRGHARPRASVSASTTGRSRATKARAWPPRCGRPASAGGRANARTARRRAPCIARWAPASSARCGSRACAARRAARRCAPGSTCARGGEAHGARMSPPGRPKGEYRSAQREGAPSARRAVPRANTGARSAKVLQ